MLHKRNPGKIAEQRAKLAAIGFTNCNDYLQVITTLPGIGAIVIDFSAINEEMYLEHALKELFLEGRLRGRNELRDGLTQLLQPEYERNQ